MRHMSPVTYLALPTLYAIQVKIVLIIKLGGNVEKEETLKNNAREGD